ncbi:CREB/ATF bZIP transcription factor-like isoform X1 [Melanaphis sacchari]|uniref:CREB/ATF bZIP transcription factor-like isoform X1 n=1 Tax=Melanaphis sacchari TaxID=742174 RepID=UPI000DC15119|nr:CREB/ATF bZIP transcription factor-like isoform X1 [Melanaphis sacchari]
MVRSCSSSDDTSSAKYEFSDSDSDHKRRGRSSRPRRLPTSNSKNAVAARINRMKQKQYVKDLEQKMSQLKREIRGVKRELKEREEKWASSRRQVAYLRGMIANSHQIGGLLRNIRWRNIIPQGSNIDKTLNELNSDASIDHFPITTSHSLFDGYFDLLEERDSNHPHMVPPPVAPQEDEGWALLDGINPTTTELFQETVPSKYVSVCTLLP